MSSHDADPAEAAKSILWVPDWSETFDSRIRFGERHWLWMGYVDPRDGYGRFKPMHAVPSMLAHRLAYVRWVGPINDDAPVIDHLGHPWHLRRCVRPGCLEAITFAENIRRGQSPAGINARRTHCPRCGSEYNEANTFYRPNNERRCRICLREEKRRYRARRKEAEVQAEPEQDPASE